MPIIFMAVFFFVILLSSPAVQATIADSPAQLKANDDSVTTPSSPSTTNKHDVEKVANIVIVSHPIFDESAPDAIFLHRWANYLHINTKESTILNSLSFEKGEKITQKDLQEAQRLLRYEPYIRDADINIARKDPLADDNVEDVVLVETWDNWSLLPTVSLSKNGGDTKYSFGIKEDNLLGLGVKTKIKYQSSADRTGYKFAFDAPVRWIKHGNVSVDFYDNSDGQASAIAFNKPFYTLDTQNMYALSWLTDTRIDTIRQNGQDINEFEHVIDYANVGFGWLVDKTPDQLHRISLGITQDQHQFNNIDDYPISPLPFDREFVYPWISYEYLQDQYTVLNNIHLINNNEDFNLGWHHTVSLGLETNDVADNAAVGYHVMASSSRGWQDDNQLLLMTLNARTDIQTGQQDFYNVGLAAEFFHQISPKWTAYSKARIATSHNNYLDQTFALGDETGVRGYPNDYQHGDNQWLLTSEIRYYPNINLYQLAELGWAVFADIGQASGGPDEQNEVDGPIGSIGIGARIYSSKSSYGNVAHVDIAVPITTGNDINAWEFRFQVKDHF
ncbi:ShlB/FhaC/HecB family hemolysin secretion/activation protein [Shewanella frigidimarina]|uniref:ShlB/FhaC/HecB family hemolysin secretion/activation protein n=1 Tax=Shewanella frigidimarina TaxID=56812 RepID=UPI003D7BDD86